MTKLLLHRITGRIIVEVGITSTVNALDCGNSRIPLRNKRPSLPQLSEGENRIPVTKGTFLSADISNFVPTTYLSNYRVSSLSKSVMS